MEKYRNNLKIFTSYYRCDRTIKELESNKLTLRKS